jgi:hypothetical protein
MNRIRFSKSIGFVLLFVFILALYGCGSSGGGGDNNDNAATDGDTNNQLSITGGEFYVHVKFLGNQTSYLTVNGSTIIPTFRFVMIDSYDNRVNIEAYRSLYEGGDYLNGQPVSFSAWSIDNVSLDEPDMTETISYTNGYGMMKTIYAWHLVALPDNFNPVKYIVGYSNIVDFPF